MNLRDAHDLFTELNDLDEHHRIEAKATVGGLGRSVLETICAYANEPGMGGGWLLLGVTRGDHGYEVVGVQDPDKLSAELSTQCAQQFNRPLRPQIRTERLEGKLVLTVFVPEASPGDKPLYIEKHGLPAGAFRRVGSTDQRCNEDDLMALYAGRIQESFDASVPSDAEWTDLDPDAIQLYRRIRESISPDAEELLYSDEDLMLALKCARRLNGDLRPTVAGILLFGTRIALRRHFPMASRADYLRVSGKEWVSDPDRRFVAMELRAPLVSAIPRLTEAILDEIPKQFVLEEGQLQRQDVPLIPERVIREAVVNTLMHRSYRSHAPTLIVRYSNRIEFRNPGHSLKDPESLGQPGSEPRNPILSGVLHELRFAEAKGSGIRTMRDLMRQANLSVPTFDSDRQHDAFMATLFMHHFMTAEDVAWLASFREFNLADEEARALVFVRETGAIDNATYRELNQVDTLNASSHLRRLRDLSLFEAREKGAATYYVPTRQLFRSGEPSTEAGLAEKSPKPSKESHMPFGESHMPFGENTYALSREGDSTGALRLNLEELPADIQELLAERSAWRRRNDFRALLKRLCAWRSLTAEQLAHLTDRRKDHLVREYLTPMIREGQLEYTIPAMPRHPNQAYRTTEHR